MYSSFEFQRRNFFFSHFPIIEFRNKGQEKKTTYRSPTPSPKRKWTSYKQSTVFLSTKNIQYLSLCSKAHGKTPHCFTTYLSSNNHCHFQHPHTKHTTYCSLMIPLVLLEVQIILLRRCPGSLLSPDEVHC